MNPLTGSVTEVKYRLDFNLDGVFDELDDDVTYDFNFAVLTSGASFSCGNALPIYAKENGILILGETSGGGSCYVTERYLADGFAFPISDISKSYIEGVDFDLGAAVDYDLRTVNEDGTVDYSGLYDIDGISALMHSFYGDNEFEPGDVNGDGDVTTSDVLILRKSLVGLVDLTAEELLRGDVTGDGDITTSDVLRVRRIIVGLD